jgi:hypothetical protein
MSYDEWKKAWAIRQRERRRTLKAMLSTSSREMRRALAQAALATQTLPDES